jgi:ABC-2 type transport system permease protein
MSSPTIEAPRVARQDVHIVSARKPVTTRLHEIWNYRELLLSLVRKELKVKYKDSILGFAWSMLNPLFTLCIYYVVFQIILGNNQPLFAIYLLSGLLVWNFFSNALAGAVGSVTGNSSIVKKVAFPREVLPLASVGAAAFNFLLQLVVMVGALAIAQHAPSPTFLLVAVVAFVVLTFFASALAIFLAAVNVGFRDTQHLLELVLMLWFWATPITYQFMLVANKLDQHNWPAWLGVLNPITPITL